MLAHLLAADAVGGARLDDERACRSAMTAFRTSLDGAPCISGDNSPTLLYYLGRDRLPHVAEPGDVRAWLAAHPGGFAIVEGTVSDLAPVLRGLPVRASWTSPRGRQGWVLLGPGVG